MYPISIIVFVFSFLNLAIGQQPGQAPVADASWLVRYQAFQKLQQQAKGHYTEAQKAQLLATLQQESKFAEDFGAKYRGSKDLGEGFGEYWSELLGAVSSFADLRDPSVLRILVFAGYDPDSDFAKRLIAQKENVLPAIRELSHSPDPFSRANAAGLLKNMAQDTSLPCAATRDVTDMLISLANDVDGPPDDAQEGVKWQAVEGLATIRSPRAVAALQKVAQSESKSVKDDDGTVRHPLSDQAKGHLRVIAETGGPKAAPCDASSPQSK